MLQCLVDLLTTVYIREEMRKHTSLCYKYVIVTGNSDKNNSEYEIRVNHALLLLNVPDEY